MPFDITKAQPAKVTGAPKKGGFDPRKAQPAGAAGAQRPAVHPLVSEERKRQGQARIEALNEERSQIENQRQSELGVIEALRPFVRTASLAPRAFLGPASMIEQAVVGIPNAFGADIPTPFTDSYHSFTPEGMGAGLENRNGLERAVDFTGEIATGAGAETKIAQGLQKAPGALRSIGDFVIDVLADNPKAAATAAAGAGAGGSAAHELQTEEFQAEHPIASQLLDTAGAAVGGAGPVAVAGRRAASTPVRAEPPNEAQVARGKFGAVVAPSSATAVGGAKGVRGTVARTLEGLAGTQNVKNRAARMNAPKIEKAAGRDIGLSGEQGRLTDAQLKAAAEPAHEVRKELVKLLKDTPNLDIDEPLKAAVEAAGARRRKNPALDPTPSVERVRERMSSTESMTVQEMIDAVSELRDDAKGFYQRGDRAAGKAARDLANAFEDRLERAAVEAGDPKFAQRFKEARELLAKTHDLEVGRTKSGRVDPAKLGRQKGKPTGAIKAIGDAGEAFPGEMRPVSKLSNTKSRPDSLWGTIRNFAQDNVFDPMIGRYLLSEGMQDALVGPAGMVERRAALPDQPRPQMKGPQGDAFGPNGDLSAPPGDAGGPMPSDTRRLASTMDDQGDAFGSAFEFEAPEGLPGPMPSDVRRLESLLDHQNALRLEPFDLEAPEGVVGGRGRAAPLSDREALDLELAPGFAELDSVGPGFIFERRSAEPAPYTGIERRVNGVPDLSAERARVLQQEIGAKPIADQLVSEILAKPGMRGAVRDDTVGNRQVLNPLEPDADLPIGAGLKRGAPTQNDNLAISDLVDPELAQYNPASEIPAGDVLPRRTKPPGAFVDNTPTLEELDAAVAEGGLRTADEAESARMSARQRAAERWQPKPQSQGRGETIAELRRMLADSEMFPEEVAAHIDAYPDQYPPDVLAAAQKLSEIAGVRVDDSTPAYKAAAEELIRLLDDSAG